MNVADTVAVALAGAAADEGGCGGSRCGGWPMRGTIDAVASVAADAGGW